MCQENPNPRVASQAGTIEEGECEKEKKEEEKEEEKRKKKKQASGSEDTVQKKCGDTYSANVEGMFSPTFCT